MRNFKPFIGPQIEKVDLSGHTRLDIEIGCGVGLHPIQYARAHTERTLVAIEHTKIKYEKFFRRYQHHQSPTNLIPVHANALSWISLNVSEDSVDNFFILYPNPEKQNKSKRWMRMPFMQKIKSSLKPGGQLHLASNEEWYIDEAKEWAQQEWKFKLAVAEEVKQHRTHFEKKYLERGDRCWNLIFTKT